MDTTQLDIYDAAALPIVESVLEGFNGTIFAYGQTSSGKTHTMQGVDINDPETKGIIPRIVSHIFHEIDEASEDIEFTVKVSMIEIYMERIRDLLDPKKINLQVHEDKEKGVFIGDVTETYVTEDYEVNQIMQIGNENRSIGVTDMNKQSSRSHSCFIMNVTQNNTSTFQCKTGKLYLVDLAGSEKISKTGATGQTLDEAKKINKSLSALGMVINSLTDGKSKHIPYRDSKLTRILQESLGGNSKTCLIITCSPSTYNEAETISTLRFGQRAKKIQNKPKINKEMSIAELKLLLEKAEAQLDKKDRRIRNLEKIIKNLGGKVPEEKDDFIQRTSVKEPSDSTTKKNDAEEAEDLEDVDEANAKIDAIETFSHESSDAEYSDNEDENNAQTNLLDDEAEEDLDSVPSNLDTDHSETSQKAKAHKPNQKSQIDTLNETFAMLEDAAKSESKDAETNTEAVSSVSVKTNTSPPKTVNTGTSLHIETSTSETMTQIEVAECGVGTEQQTMQLQENGIQTSPIESNDKETLTDKVEFTSHEELESNQMEQHEFSEMEQVDVKKYEPMREESKEDSIVERAKKVQQDYSESGIQTHTDCKTLQVQTSVQLIEQSTYDALVDEHEVLVKKNDEEVAIAQTKLTEALQTIEEQKKSITTKETTLHEQLEEIEQLTAKVSELERSLSDDKDLCESQKELLENHEAKVKEQQTNIEEQESLINAHAEKVITIEKDLKNKEEQFNEKTSELAALQEQTEQLTNKYSNVKHEYGKLKKENDMLVEKAATLHMSVEEITKKNQKYKKQLVYMQDDQQVCIIYSQLSTDSVTIIHILCN